MSISPLSCKGHTALDEVARVTSVVIRSTINASRWQRAPGQGCAGAMHGGAQNPTQSYSIGQMGKLSLGMSKLNCPEV